MTLGPAFGAPPPSDFNEPHDLHHEPAPLDPDAAGRSASTDAEPRSSEPASPPEANEPKGLSRWFGWLRRSG